MTKKKQAAPKAGSGVADTRAREEAEKHKMTIVASPGDQSKRMAEAVLHPLARSAAISKAVGANLFGGKAAEPTMDNAVAVIGELAAKARTGDLGAQSDMLVGHAMLLDTMFTTLATKATNNLLAGPEYAAAGENYLRMALKAQTQARQTVEALAKLHQPREQTVRHVHVYEGGQAVVADQFHHHNHGGYGYAHFNGQPHEAARAGSASPSAPVLGSESSGQPLPASGDAERALSSARREIDRSAEG